MAGSSSRLHFRAAVYVFDLPLLQGMLYTRMTRNTLFPTDSLASESQGSDG
jgi:hypothetical protein